MKYLFLISWLRAREKKLADNVDIDRMIGAGSAEESFRVLNDTDYAPYISAESYESIEQVIKKEREDFSKELYDMGVEQEMIDVLFLRDDLVVHTKRAKELFFLTTKEREEELRKEDELVVQILEQKPQTPHHIDRIAVDIYFQRTIDFLKKQKDAPLLSFFQEYYQAVCENEEDVVERDRILEEMEDKIIENSKSEIEGFAPILSFFIMKRRIEYRIRVVLAGKRTGIVSGEIYNLLNKTRALL